MGSQQSSTVRNTEVLFIEHQYTQLAHTKSIVIFVTMATMLLSHYLVFVALWYQIIVLYDVIQLLLLIGDVHLNSGPPTCYPCAMCYCLVHWNQKALLCDACGLLSHCKCCNVSDLEYSRYQGFDKFSQHCPSCTVKTQPFHDCSILTSSDIFVSSGR